MGNDNKIKKIEKALKKMGKQRYKGRRNRTILPDFVSLCGMEQAELKTHLANELSKLGKEVRVGDGYIFVPGEDVLLTAHMDTVHKEPVETFFEEKRVDPKTKTKRHYLTSPQGIGGDDRCGIYTIMEIVREGKYNPAILFCEDEEIGGIGSGKFVKTAWVDQIRKLKFYIEIDRRGNNDAVFYDCGNEGFKEFVCGTTGCKEEWGSFSDISNLSPATDVASVNISSGYYDEHTLAEAVCIEDLLDTIGKVKLLLEAAKTCTPYDYQMVRYGRYDGLFGRKGYGWDDWDDWDDWGYGYHGYRTNGFPPVGAEDKVGIEIMYMERDGDKQYEGWWYVEEVNVSACFGAFFQTHPNICFNDILDWEYYGNHDGNTMPIIETKLEKEG